MPPWVFGMSADDAPASVSASRDEVGEPGGSSRGRDSGDDLPERDARFRPSSGVGADEGGS